MKIYHDKTSQVPPLDKTGTPPSEPSVPANAAKPFGDPSAVSRGALALFRLIERLSRRLGYAHVRIAPSDIRPGKSLAEMLEKCARHVRRLLSELLALGWIARQCDGRMVYLKPLLRVIEAAKAPRVPAPKGAFLVAKMSGLMSGLKRENVRSRHLYHTTDTNKGDNNKQPTPKTESFPESKPCPVAVSLLKTCVSETEALDLAREAGKQKLSEDQIKRVIAAYRQAKNVLNRGAWLREALRRGFSPAAPVSTHASDQGGVPVAKKVILTKEQLFGNHRQQAQAGNTPGRPQEPILGAPEAPMGKDRFRAEMMALRARG